jgi:hypothetical protein
LQRIPEEQEAAPASRAPRHGLQLMALIVVVLALLAVFSNVQKAHRAEIEKVTITAAPGTPPPSPMPVAQ